MFKLFTNNDNGSIEIINHDSITEADSQQLSSFTNKLANWYPIGNKKFTIDYSDHYFNFFKSLGSEGYHVVYKVNGVICGSLCARLVRNAWYFCDLKIDPLYRGKKITYKLFLKNCIYTWFKSHRGYAISMYPNEAVKKLNNAMPFMNMKNMGLIHIFLVDCNTMQDIIKQLKDFYKHKYNGFININNCKRLKLNTGDPLNVLHFYHKNYSHPNLIPCDILNDINYATYQFFFCILEKDLHAISLNIKPYGLATLYARKMQITEFTDLGTFEI